MAVDIIALVLALLCIVSGIKRGFVKAFFGTLSFIFALILTFSFSDQACKFVAGSELGKSIYEKTAVKIVDAPETENETFFDELIDKKGIIEKANEAQMSVSEEIGNTVIKLLTTALLFIGFSLLLKLLSLLLDLAAKLPIIKGFNKAGGLVAGIINAYIVLTVFSCLMTFLGASAVSETVTRQMAESKAVTWFYLNNPLL